MNSIMISHQNHSKQQALHKADLSFKMAYIVIRKQSVLQIALQIIQILFVAGLLFIHYPSKTTTQSTIRMLYCGLIVSTLALGLRMFRHYVFYGRNPVQWYLELAHLTNHLTPQPLTTPLSIHQATSQTILTSKPRQLLYQSSLPYRTQKQITKAAYSIRDGMWYGVGWEKWWWTAVTVLGVGSMVGSWWALVGMSVGVTEALGINGYFGMAWVLDIMGKNVIGRAALWVGAGFGAMLSGGLVWVKQALTSKKVPPKTGSPQVVPGDIIRQNSLSMMGVSEEGHDCPICLNGIEGGELVFELPCSAIHRFHSVCLEEWLTDHATCPCCRANIDADALQPSITVIQ